MPRYKNSFKSGSHWEETIVDEKVKMLGTIRIKPVSVLWKPRRQQLYFSVTLDKFTSWITDPKTKAKRTKS
jgi:hypothetical protein